MAGRAAAVRRGLALGLVGWLAACGSDAPEPGATTADAYDYAADDRFAVLLAGCEKNVYYDVETADVGAILIATLVQGQRDPLKYAKAELAFGPPAGREEVRRVAERYWEQPGGEAYVRNALDVALLADDDVLVGILRRALEHPIESLRTLGLQGIAKHGGPEDYDAVLALIAVAERAELERALVTLHDVDPRRAEAEFATWLRAAYLQDFWPLLAARFARAQSPAFLETAQELVEELPPDIAPCLWVALSNAGIEGADERLDELLSAAEPDRRNQAVFALSSGGQHRRLGGVFLDDEDPRVRVAAASALADVEPGEPFRSWFRRALDDRDPTVRAIALRKLVEWDDPEARAAALHRLESDETGVRESGFVALRGSLADDAQLAADVFDRLEAAFRTRSHRPVEDNVGLLKLIGSVPDPRAARLLLELARTAEGEIQSFSTYRWLVRAASNGGEDALELLAAELARETDPERRLDLLEAVAGSGGDVAREALLAFVLDEGEDPLLVLFAAERLARIGPATRVLPVLKRVFLRAEDARVREGLQCLLWHWYPPPL